MVHRIIARHRSGRADQPSGRCQAGAGLAWRQNRTGRFCLLSLSAWLFCAQPGRYHECGSDHSFNGGGVVTLSSQAIYQDGQLKFKETLALAEGTLVHVTITPIDE